MDFFVGNINSFYSLEYGISNIILPLGISFFTFQQIAYLVDKYRGYNYGGNFLHYVLFVSFFPQLIAGPIVHYKEIIPQLVSDNTRDISKNIAIGLSIFIVGLFKKVVLADSVAAYATPVFDAAADGVSLTIFEAWAGSLAYTLQLYFDFSGYSDMAIGLAMLFGVRLPVNFLSPYKATSIIDFWSRWHITLSQFLKDYLYIPLGGNRRGSFKRYQNLMITMLLGGLWHGAGWTFIVWGGLHGVYLMLNHAWRAWKNKYIKRKIDNRYYNIVAWIMTFSVVVFSWVVFRADSIDSAIEIYKAMLGFNGVSFPVIFDKYIDNYSIFSSFSITSMGMFRHGIADWNIGIPFIILLILIVIKMPNSIEIFNKNTLEFNNKIKGDVDILWSPSLRWSIVITISFIVCIEFMRGSVTEFLYFQF